MKKQQQQKKKQLGYIVSNSSTGAVIAGMRGSEQDLMLLAVAEGMWACQR